MKKNLIAWVLFLSVLATVAWANTTYYNVPLAIVGGSQNSWGSITNSAFQSYDTQIWTNNGGLTTAVNAPASSAVNISLTNPIKNIQNLSFSTTGKQLNMPPMNATLSPVAGGNIYITNVGSNTFAIDAADGSTSILASLAANQSVTLQPLTNSTTNGTWNVNGPYLTSVGTLTLGSSAGAPNPTNGTSGLFSATTTSVGVSVSGSQVASFLSTGLNGTAIGATTSSTALFTTATTQTAHILGGSIDSTAIGATTSSTALFSTITVGACNGCGTAGIGNVTGQTFCASGCTHTAGTYTPTAGTKYIVVELTGGGGGGGGAGGATAGGGGGGGAGGYLKAVLTSAQFGASQTITIGAAGTAGSASSGGTGGNGGTTSMGSLLSAAGGTGGAPLGGSNTASNGGAGGSATVTTGTTLNVATGQAGSGGYQEGASVGGAGGSNTLGYGGGGPSANSSPAGATAGNNATGLGGGGGSGSCASATTGLAGGAGGGGFVSITEYQ